MADPNPFHSLIDLTRLESLIERPLTFQRVCEALPDLISLLGRRHSQTCAVWLLLVRARGGRGYQGLH